MSRVIIYGDLDSEEELDLWAHELAADPVHRNNFRSLEGRRIRAAFVMPGAWFEGEGWWDDAVQIAVGSLTRLCAAPRVVRLPGVGDIP